MKALKKVTVAPYDVHKDIVASKRGDRRVMLDGLATTVQTRYDAVGVLTRANLHTFTKRSWSDQHKEALHHCYTSATETLVSLKKTIKLTQARNQRAFCPYCLIARSTQYDHYMPKDPFPEFSVHPHNLVPICNSCNSLKGDTWLVNSTRPFLNFYVDILPDDQFLFVDITWVKAGADIVPVADFRLERPKKFRIEAFELVEAHFESLNLIERYREATSDEFDELLDVGASAGAVDRHTLRTVFAHYLHFKGNRLGVSDWRVVLLETLSSDRNFLKMCEAQASS